MGLQEFDQRKVLLPDRYTEWSFSFLVCSIHIRAVFKQGIEYPRPVLLWHIRTSNRSLSKGDCHQEGGLAVGVFLVDIGPGI